MDIETAKVLGKSAIVITLLILGFLAEKYDKDSGGYFFCALMAFVYFLS